MKFNESFLKHSDMACEQVRHFNFRIRTLRNMWSQVFREPSYATVNFQKVPTLFENWFVHTVD